MNKRHQLLSAAAAATLGLASLIGAAAPAHAAASIGPVVLTCSAGTIFSGSPFQFFFAEVQPGDTITFDNQTGQTLTVTELTTGMVTPTPPTTISAGNAEIYTVVAAGDLQFVGATTCTTPAAFELVINSGPSPSPQPSGQTSSSTPTPVIQQFGMPTTGTCDEAQPEGLNLAGVPSGGWGISWAQWMNGGTGGAVCTRTLNYSTVQSKWVVN